MKLESSHGPGRQGISRKIAINAARQATLLGPKCAFMCAEAQWIAWDKDGSVIPSKSACVVSYQIQPFLCKF